jgi:hypothetical protein
MNGRTKSKRTNSLISDRPTCLQCPETDKREARTRGLCRRCYARNWRNVLRGLDTWDELEATNRLAKRITFPRKVRKPAGCWLNHQVFESSKYGTCRLQTAAAKRSGLPSTSLGRWASGPCRHNDGEKIFTLLVPPPIVIAGPKAPVFPDNVINRVAESYRKWSKPDTDEDAKPLSNDDDAWLTTVELEQKLGVSKDFVNYWKKRESRLRPGEIALRVHLESSADKPGRVRNEQQIHRLGDARAILAGKESVNPLIGRPATRRPNAKTDSGAQTIIHEHLLEMGGTTTRTHLFDLCRAHSIAGRQRRLAIKNLRIRPVLVGRSSQRGSYYCLPGKPAPSPLPHAPALQKAVEFLKSALAKKPLPRKELIKLARQRGIAKSNLTKAKPFAGVVSKLDHPFATWKLVGIAGHNGDTNAKASTPVEQRDPGQRKRRKRRAASMHRLWKQWKDEGLSYNQIVQKHKDEFKRTITRGAVMHALARL